MKVVRTTESNRGLWFFADLSPLFEWAKGGKGNRSNWHLRERI